VISPLLANSIAADAGLIPGLAIVGPAMGLPVSVLAAFIERPFVTRAGFGKSAIWFSLQANFVSLLVGYVATLVVLPFVMSPNIWIGLVWPFLAVGISIVTERQYLNARLSPTHVPWLPIAVANVVSAASCIVVLIVAVNLRSMNRHWAIELRPYEGSLTVIAAAFSLLLMAGSFLASTPRQGEHKPTEPSDGAESR
jgi:hypothetical protein